MITQAISKVTPDGDKFEVDAVRISQNTKERAENRDKLKICQSCIDLNWVGPGRQRNLLYGTSRQYGPEKKSIVLGFSFANQPKLLPKIVKADLNILAY